MSWLSDLFGGDPDQGANQPPVTAPAQQVSADGQPTPTQPMSTYGDYYNNVLNAAKAQTHGRPGTLLGLLNILDGNQQASDIANAKAGVPNQYFNTLQQQTAAQSGQIDLGQTLALMQRMHAQDPNVPDPRTMMGAQGPAGVLGPQAGQPQGQPQPSPQMAQPVQQAPSGNAPQGQGAQPAPAAPASPPIPTSPGQNVGAPQAPGEAQMAQLLQRIRAGQPQGANPATASAGPAGMPMPQAPAGGPMAPAAQPATVVPAPQPTAAGSDPGGIRAQTAGYANMKNLLYGLPKYLPQVMDYSKLQQTGVPAELGAVRGNDGRLYDSSTGQVLQGDVGQIEAHRAGMTAGAQSAANMPFINAERAYGGNVDIGVHTANAKTDAGLALTKYMDPATGLMRQGTVAQAVAAAQASPGQPGQPGSAGQPVGFADPDTHQAQIKQIVESQSDAKEAAGQQYQVQLLGEALKNSPMTGPGSQILLNAMRVTNTLGLLDPESQSKVANGELAGQQGVEVAGVLAKQISGGRTPLGIFNQVAKNKPQLLTSNPGIMISAINQDLQRQQDRADYIATYYSHGANSDNLSADTAFNQTHPIAMYESRVLPLPFPQGNAPRKVGYTYQTPNGHPLVWSGTGWQAPGQ